ncbi:MAG: translation initiation factor IF-2 subunit gamma [Candidatus Micrarchaeota archaeon]|nr:translation initiation factor IF-2 subunit gamma [Candidatus Micrarchaeota archaeon]
MVQSELNIMTAGHVDHGKTTLTHALTGKWTDTHSEEVKRGITIKLGYADTAVYKCPKCPEPEAFTNSKKCGKCGGQAELQRMISFVDAPGHETLMATVIAASSIVDGALFVIAASEKCPQAQTAEHLAVLETVGIRNVVVAQNKVDLVTKERALESLKEIRALLKGTLYENAPVIPVAANSRINVDALLQAIQENIPTPKRNLDAAPRLYVARSFDVNKPGAAVEKILGGVVGGSLLQGKLRAGEELELLPGMLRHKKGQDVYEPVKTKIASLNAGAESVPEAGPGGLIGIATLLDPSLTKADSLVGCVAGRPGTLPPVWKDFSVEVFPIARQVQKFPETFIQNEPLVLGAGTATTVGFVASAKKKKNFILSLQLKKPICADKATPLAVMRRSQNRWHLYGTAKIVS